MWPEKGIFILIFIFLVWNNFIYWEKNTIKSSQSTDLDWSRGFIGETFPYNLSSYTYSQHQIVEKPTRPPVRSIFSIAIIVDRHKSIQCRSLYQIVERPTRPLVRSWVSITIIVKSWYTQTFPHSQQCTASNNWEAHKASSKKQSFITIIVDGMQEPPLIHSRSQHKLRSLQGLQ